MSDIKLERIHPIRIMLGKILDVLEKWVKKEYRQEDVVVEIQRMREEFEGFEEITWYSSVSLPVSLTDLCESSEDRSVIAYFPVELMFTWDGKIQITIRPTTGKDRSSIFDIDSSMSMVKVDALGLKIAYATIKRVLDEFTKDESENNEEKRG